jgi:alpha-L-fucosidase
MSGWLVAGNPADPDFELQEFKVDPSVQLPTASQRAHEAWKDERFGMFIHWGPISQMGMPLSHSRNSPSHHPGGKPYKVASIPPEVYDAQYQTFNPVKFDPDAIVEMARRAGVRYVVFTAKHHAGFSMFDSAVTDYDIMSAPYKKDIVKLLSDACHARGLHFGFYYSPRDWHHPDCDSAHHHDRYIKFYKSQIYELLTKYGPIHEVWFDGLGPGNWGDTAREVMAMIRKLQPDAMVNDRGGAGADFHTPEHQVGYFNRDECWEACHTTTSQWGYNPRLDAKPLAQLLEIMLYVWGGDGNLLLNIGPMGDGAVNPKEAERFRQLADWWAVHGDTSIRASRGGPYLPGPWGVATCKDRRVFLHVFRWPPHGALRFPALPGLHLQSARLLTGKSVRAAQQQDALFVDVAPADREPIVTTIELRFDGPTRPVTPLPRVPSLLDGARLTASHNPAALDRLRDRNAATTWDAVRKKGESEIWVEVAFPHPQTVASFQIARGRRWIPRFALELQVPDAAGGWRAITPKNFKLKWEPVKFLKEPVTTQRLRLRVTGAKRFSIAEFELYPPVGK